MGLRAMVGSRCQKQGAHTEAQGGTGRQDSQFMCQKQGGVEARFRDIKITPKKSFVQLLNIEQFEVELQPLKIDLTIHDGVKCKGVIRAG